MMVEEGERSGEGGWVVVELDKRGGGGGRGEGW